MLNVFAEAGGNPERSAPRISPRVQDQSPRGIRCIIATRWNYWQTVLLHFLKKRQQATVFQLPATPEDAKASQRAAYV
jgi:hypothetical protein